MPGTITPPSGSDSDLWHAFIRNCLGLLKATGYQASICFGFAGLLTLGAIALGVGVIGLPAVFLMAFLIPLPFVKIYNTPPRLAKRELLRLKAMKDVELISEDEYERYRVSIVSWLENEIVPSLADRSGPVPAIRKPARKRGPQSPSRN